ncbi:Dps family protein [Rhodohalobacter barkolensis]|uniref:DNA starvation/stationary phase protection protein n=1 Tax=Rhodohalobacter barkolensis TaxID=2053187 RepID=A0A2N0VLA9_9BACT|nr:Dps family protein [Rhodohalobacter barkolensis]PKD44970.1 DNA starvation/stationary phase protection protein [Rhodohalobacter barkolensis]
MDIGIKESDRKKVAAKLQKLLADEHVIYIKTRNYHWNIKAANFAELHAFYEEQYGELEGVIDEIAERIRMIGFLSTGRMSEFLKLTELKEGKEITDSGEQVSNLMKDHESVIKYLRNCIRDFEDLNDMGSADFVTALMQQHEKMRWMLESFLPK